jgi:hypothetical protein
MPCDTEFSFASVVRFRQINPNSSLQRFSARSSGTSATTSTTSAAASTKLKPKALEKISEGAEDVINIVKTTAATSAFDASVSVAIVASSLVSVVQNFKGL